MALIHSFEKSGNTLFRNRSYFPLILFAAAIPVILTTNYQDIHQTLRDILTIIAIITSLSGFLIRAVSIATTPKGTSGRNTKSGQVAESLNHSGIYSMVRHPLYLGNFLMWIGIAIFTFNIYFIIIVSFVFWLYYERIMFAEERFLERKFGDDYLQWSGRTPAFFPSFKHYEPNRMPFSIKSVLRREYSGFLATVLSFTFIDFLRQYAMHGWPFEWNRISLYALVISLILTLTLRTLKHHTRLLNESDRS
ncbi:MAG: isoprenylcysteine carboxylmethyltransferase family protein [Bacteroidales bacterium]